MGIYGFTLYMHNNESRYLKPFELHNTQLVVDGASTATNLYKSLENSHGVFGGDYDRFFNYCEQFFDDLLACNVHPLVLFDGGLENRKLDTITSRLHKTTELFLNPSQYLVNSLNPGPGRQTVGPIFTIKIFIQVLEKKKIKYVKTLFEADNAIASISRILNCPVLSLDSDFYTHGGMYVPFNLVMPGVQQNKDGMKVKHCKLFHAEKFLQMFGGTDVSVLALTGVLLGNDYIKEEACENFHLSMKLMDFDFYASRYQNRMGKRLSRIERTLKWLSLRTFNAAVKEIISTIPPHHYEEVMNAIERVVHDYNDMPIHVMKTFGYDDQFILEKSKSLMIKGFEKKAKRMEEIQTNEVGIAVHDLPNWFIENFAKGMYSGAVLDILMKRLYVSMVQIDQSSGKVLNTVILPILKILYSLLVSGYQREKEYLTHITFDKDAKLKHLRIEYQSTIFGCGMPNLQNVKELPFCMKTKILEDVLTINTYDLENFPPIWKLYVGTIIYWKKQKEETIASKIHVHALLFSLLFGVVDKKIGFQRCAENFKKKYNASQETKRIPSYSTPNTVIQAYDEVNSEDCILIAPFFMERFKIDPNLVRAPYNLISNRVYAAFQFQHCLNLLCNLNAVLDSPYPNIALEQCFNGTLFYNLCSEFQNKLNIKSFINDILCNCPSLKRLYDILWSIVESLCCIGD